MEGVQNSSISGHFKDLGRRLVNIIERPVPAQFMDLQEKFPVTLGNLQQLLDLIVKYDWDFDHYLEEDLPAAVR